MFFRFLSIGFYSFNAGISEVLLRQIVEKEKWLNHSEYARVLSLTTLIPGPYHINLVIATGYALNKFKGGLAAVLGFVLPGFLIAVTIVSVVSEPQLSLWLTRHPGVSAGFLAAIAGLVLSAMVRLGTRALPSMPHWLMIPLITALLVVFRLPFALAILGCGLASVLLLVLTSYRRKPSP